MIKKSFDFFESYTLMIGTCQHKSKEAWAKPIEGGSIPLCQIYWSKPCQYSIERSRL